MFKTNALRGLTTRILVLVLAPALILGVAMVWQIGKTNNMMQSSVTTLSGQMERMMGDEANIQMALIASQNLTADVQAFTNHQQSSLLIGDLAAVEKGRGFSRNCQKARLIIKKSLPNLRHLIPSSQR